MSWQIVYLSTVCIYIYIYTHHIVLGNDCFSSSTCVGIKPRICNVHLWRRGLFTNDRLSPKKQTPRLIWLEEIMYRPVYSFWKYCYWEHPWFFPTVLISYVVLHIRSNSEKTPARNWYKKRAFAGPSDTTGQGRVKADRHTLSDGFS